MSFGVDLFWPAYLAAAFAAAAVAAHVLAYRRTTRPVAGWARGALLAVRLTALALLIFVLWRPAAQSETNLTRKSRMVVLIDASRSMSIADEDAAASKRPGQPGGPGQMGGPGQLTRLGRAAALFGESRDTWEKIAEGYDVAGYSFSKGLKPLPVSAVGIADKPLFGVTADGPLTALGDALEEVSRMTPPPDAVLVISDGLSNSGIDPLDAALPGGDRGDRGTTIYAISVGQDRPTASTRDAAVTAVFAPSQAVARAEIEVRGELSLTGMEGRNVKATLYVNGKEVESREVSTTQARGVAEARFTYKPMEAGPMRVEVRARPGADDIVAANNAAATYVDVRPGNVHVLYAEGAFWFETKFIRRALEATSEIDQEFVIVKEYGDPALAEALSGDWDVLVMRDLPARFMTQETMAAIAAAVAEKGRGIIMLGGRGSFGSGGYAGTPLAPCIPFDVRADEELDRGLYALAGRHEGPYSKVVEFPGRASLDFWRGLPPLAAVNRAAARPGAAVLLDGLPVALDEATGLIAPDGTRETAPVLAVADYGKGRTAAFAGDGTWQWVTGAGLKDEAARDEAAAIHQRFWRQMFFWLARHEERGGLTLTPRIARRRVEMGQTVEMEAVLADAALSNLTDAKVTCEITAGGKSYARDFWLEGDRYRGDFAPPAAGDYAVRIKAARPDGTTARADTAFVVAGGDVELATLVGKPALLDALARSTGGAYASASGGGEVFARINERAREFQYARLERQEIWSSYWYLAAVLALLTSEWALRKAVGLV